MFKVLEDPGGELCTEEARQQAGGQAQEAGHQAHQVIRNKNLMKKGLAQVFKLGIVLKRTLYKAQILVNASTGKFVSGSLRYKMVLNLCL